VEFAGALGVPPLELIEEFLEKLFAGASPKTRKATKQST
jgi:hypothetical protein